MRDRSRIRGVVMLSLFLAAGVAGCGSLPPVEAAFEGGLETACLDLWSLVHFGSGFYVGHALDDENIFEVGTLLVGYELVEPSFWPGWNETLLNQNCDVVVGSLGWLFESLAQ